MRFFDDEEVMLFYFPETSVGTYQDGTYIDVEAQTTRLQNYIITPQRFVKEKNYIFSYGWDIVLPGIKEEKYGIRPLTDGQFNVAYFELLAEILTSNKECVGYAFVELICGARNDLNVFRQIGDLTKKKNKE